MYVVISTFTAPAGLQIANRFSARASIPLSLSDLLLFIRWTEYRKLISSGCDYISSQSYSEWESHLSLRLNLQRLWYFQWSDWELHSYNPVNGKTRIEVFPPFISQTKEAYSFAGNDLEGWLSIIFKFTLRSWQSLESPLMSTELHRQNLATSGPLKAPSLEADQYLLKSALPLKWSLFFYKGP
jgi:hypothetical protein